MSSIGDQIRRRRRSSQLRQTDFALFGITQSQLSMIESETIEPSPEKIEKIATALKVSPLELVAGTNVENAYLAARYTAAETALIMQTAQFTRSQRLIAVQESYERIAAFFTLVGSGPESRVASIEDEAHYQQLVRILRRAIEAARTHDGAFTDALFVPASMIEEPGSWPPYTATALKRSAALISSLLLEWPEADERSVRREIVVLLGLHRIDAYLERSAPAIGNVLATQAS